MLWIGIRPLQIVTTVVLCLLLAMIHGFIEPCVSKAAILVLRFGSGKKS